MRICKMVSHTLDSNFDHDCSVSGVSVAANEQRGVAHNLQSVVASNHHQPQIMVDSISGTCLFFSTSGPYFLLTLAACQASGLVPSQGHCSDCTAAPQQQGCKGGRVGGPKEEGDHG